MENRTKIKSITICDTLAEDSGHLLDDDDFYVKSFLLCSESVDLYSSSISCKLIDQTIHADEKFTCHSLKRNNYFLLPHTIKILLRLMELPRKSSVFFLIGFHEVATAFFLFLRVKRSQLFVLVSTNNVSNVRRSKIKRKLLSFILKRIKVFIVHSEWEKRFFSKLYPESRCKIRRINYHRAGANTKNENGTRTIDIGYLGGPRAEQGFDVLQQWIHSPNLVDLSFLLRLRKEQEALLSLSTKASDRLTVLQGSYDDTEYMNLYFRCRYILLPYTRDYIGKLSGIFCDAIATSTPVIAPRIPPFTEYFKQYGPLGILFDFTSSPDKAICEVIQSQSNYILFQSNLAKAKAAHSRTRIQGTLKVIVDELSKSTSHS